VLLRLAITKGFIDFDKLQKDKDFDAIGNRDDFKVLKKEWEAKAAENQSKGKSKKPAAATRTGGAK
jgi:hypothetical protein